MKLSAAKQVNGPCGRQLSLEIVAQWTYSFCHLVFFCFFFLSLTFIFVCSLLCHCVGVSGPCLINQFGLVRFFFFFSAFLSSRNDKKKLCGFESKKKPTH